jgi:hypothetical protein
MPNTKDSNPDQSQNGEGRVLRNFALLALPWLAFQREMLAIMKKGIEDASHVRPVENLTSRELQALMMVLDPSGKWRSLLDRDLEKKIQDIYTNTVPKYVAGSLSFIEAQDRLLGSIADLLDNLRNENKPNGHASGKTAD